MQKYFPKLTTLFSRPLVLNKRAFHTSTIKFSPPNLWEKMSEEDRINSALSDSNPSTAKMAYYKAIGFMKLGTENAAEAIYYFEKAASMDPHYDVVAKEQIAAVYALLGQTDRAYDLLHEVLNSIKPYLNVTLEDLPQIDPKTSMNHGL